MLKVYAFLTKLPQLSDDAFSARWRHPHGTLTKRIPQIRSYAQNHRIGDIAGIGTTPYSGVAAIWLDDLASLAAANSHPDYAELDADGDKLYVRANLAWLMSEEALVRPAVLEASVVPAKAMLLLNKRGGGAFDRTAMGEMADRVAAAIPDLAGIAYATPAAADQPFAGVIELAFQDVAAFRAIWPTRGPALLDALDDVDLSASRGLLAREERVIWPEHSTERA